MAHMFFVIGPDGCTPGSKQSSVWTHSEFYVRNGLVESIIIPTQIEEAFVLLAKDSANPASQAPNWLNVKSRLWANHGLFKACSREYPEGNFSPDKLNNLVAPLCSLSKVWRSRLLRF